MLKIILEVKIYKNIGISEHSKPYFNVNMAVCNIQHEKLFTQNVTNVIFSFETSPNTNPKRKKWGDMAYYVPPPEEVGGHVPSVTHQIAPMSGQHSLIGCLHEDEFCISGNYMYVWNAGKLAVRREQIRSGDKAVKMPAHAHSCHGFKPTDKLTLQVVVDQDTEEITRIQVASLGYSFHTFWQSNLRIAPCLNVEQEEQLVCSYGRVALMLSDCVGSAKHHKFKFGQYNDTADKEVDSFLLLFIYFTDRTTAAFEDIIADVHYMSCQTKHQLHQLLKGTPIRHLHLDKTK